MECAGEHAVAITRGAAESCSATVPAPAAKELGRPARAAFRRSGRQFTVAPAGPETAAAGPATGGTAPAAAASGGQGACPYLLEDRPPSEMSLEANILRYLANCLERRHGLAEGAVVPVSPTPHEEHALGFDAAVGLPPGRYAVLQFKRPVRWDGSGRACFKIGDEQALRLLQYPRGSAFYVMPPVRTNGDMGRLGRCLLRRARLVDAWDVLPSILQSWRPARAAVTSGGGKSAHSASSRDNRVAYVDGGGRGIVHIRAGRGRQPPYLPVPSEPAAVLCYDTASVGFDVTDGRMVTRGGTGWDHDEWRAEASRALKEPPGRAYRRSGGSWWADEASRDGDVDTGRPGLKKVESRFRHACGRDGPGWRGGGAYVRIADVP